MVARREKDEEVPFVYGDGPLKVITLGKPDDDCEICQAIRARKPVEEIKEIMKGDMVAVVVFRLKAGWGGR